MDQKRLDDSKEVAKKAVARLKQIAKSVHDYEMEDWEVKALESNSQKDAYDGWTENEIVNLLMHTEHVNPNLDEDTALRRMKKISDQVHARLGKITRNGADIDTMTSDVVESMDLLKELLTFCENGAYNSGRKNPEKLELNKVYEGSYTLAAYEGAKFKSIKVGPDGKSGVFKLVHPEQYGSEKTSKQEHLTFNLTLDDLVLPKVAESEDQRVVRGRPGPHPDSDQAFNAANPLRDGTGKPVKFTRAAIKAAVEGDTNYVATKDDRVCLTFNVEQDELDLTVDDRHVSDYYGREITVAITDFMNSCNELKEALIKSGKSGHGKVIFNNANAESANSIVMTLWAEREKYPGLHSEEFKSKEELLKQVKHELGQGNFQNVGGARKWFKANSEAMLEEGIGIVETDTDYSGIRKTICTKSVLFDVTLVSKDGDGFEKTVKIKGQDSKEAEERAELWNRGYRAVNSKEVKEALELNERKSPVKDATNYMWYVFGGPKAVSIIRRGRRYALRKGEVFGVRRATSSKEELFRLILDSEGPTIIFSMDGKQLNNIIKQSKKDI